MKSLNRVFIMGNLGNAPQLKMSAAGKPYTRLSVATHRPFAREEVVKDGEEEKKEITEWHSVFVWGQQAEICANRLQKGALIFVEGSLTYWEVARDTGKEYKNAVHAHSVKFLNLGRSVADAENLSNVDNPQDAPDDYAVAHPATKLA
jgi:single-strand DNA-binding protein